LQRPVQRVKRGPSALSLLPATAHMARNAGAISATTCTSIQPEALPIGSDSPKRKRPVDDLNGRPGYRFEPVCHDQTATEASLVSYTQCSILAAMRVSCGYPKALLM